MEIINISIIVLLRKIVLNDQQIFNLDYKFNNMCKNIRLIFSNTRGVTL